MRRQFGSGQAGHRKKLLPILADGEAIYASISNGPADTRPYWNAIIAPSSYEESEAKAVAAGGRAPNERKDYGFMVYHGFEDLDGHVWELMYMDPNAVPPQA